MSLLNKLLHDPVISEVPRLHNALLVKERGVRKEWLVHMDRFIEEANAWDFERQRTFVNWLLSTCERGRRFGSLDSSDKRTTSKTVLESVDERDAG